MSEKELLSLMAAILFAAQPEDDKSMGCAVEDAIGLFNAVAELRLPA